MPRYRFKIGEALPADNAVAHFVTVLAMMSNDWHRSMRTMVASLEDNDDCPGTRLLLFRQQVAYHHEATKFITKTRREYPEVGRFVDSLDAEAQAHYETTALRLPAVQRAGRDTRRFDAWKRRSDNQAVLTAGGENGSIKPFAGPARLGWPRQRKTRGPASAGPLVRHFRTRSPFPAPG